MAVTTTHAVTTRVVRRAASRATARVPLVGPLLVWSALVTTGALLVYVVLVASGRKRLDAAPLHGAVDLYVVPGLLAPVAVAVVVVTSVRLLSTLPWRRLLVAVWGAALVWIVALATVRGWHRLAAPFGQPGDYLAVLDRVPSLQLFLSTFVDRIGDYPVHVQGHPPGFVVTAWLFDQVGLGGPSVIAAVCVLAGAAGAPLALVTVRDVAGEEWARRAAPFVALAPAALWLGASADALFTGVGALSVAMLVVATGRRGRRGAVLGVAGGVGFGITMFLSYGLVLLAVIPIAVAVHRRSLAPLLAAAAGAVLVIGAFAAAGFSWIDGLFATRDRYFAGIASERPYGVFVVANLAILTIAVGPAVAVGLARLRDRRMWLLVGGALFAVAIADLSGMSKSEVERIWLPFMPFLLVAAAAIAPERPRNMKVVQGMLAGQAGVAIAVEALVRTAW